jgi:hypothetical protein
MSLMRQIGLLLAAVLLLALAGAVGINLASTRDALQTQLRLKNSDNAQNIALALSQQRGDKQLMNMLLATQADTGFYSRMRFVGADGALSFDRESAARPQVAPVWFAQMLPIESAPGTAQVSDGWRALGRVEVISHVAYAHDELWHGGARAVVTGRTRQRGDGARCCRRAPHPPSARRHGGAGQLARRRALLAGR